MMRMTWVALVLLVCGVSVVGCSSGGGNADGSGGIGGDSSQSSDGNAGGSGGSAGAGGVAPGCAAATGKGFFPDCSLCGADCDTIDDGTGTHKACGCTGGCPCGLRCGSYQIAPNVVVSNICVR